MPRDSDPAHPSSPAWLRKLEHETAAYLAVFAIEELGKLIGPDKLAGYFFGERLRKAPGTKD